MRSCHTCSAARRPRGIPVAVGAADTAAAAFGSGLVRPGTGQLTIGSGAQVLAPLAHRDRSGAARVTDVYRAATLVGWYRLGAVVNAGLSLDWVRGVLGATWSELYAAATLAAASDDPVFLPHLNGERTPYFDPSLRAGWIFLAPDTTGHNCCEQLWRGRRRRPSVGRRRAPRAGGPGTPGPACPSSRPSRRAVRRTRCRRGWRRRRKCRSRSWFPPSHGDRPAASQIRVHSGDPSTVLVLNGLSLRQVWRRGSFGRRSTLRRPQSAGH
jgi:hypothetical protein